MLPGKRFDAQNALRAKRDRLGAVFACAMHLRDLARAHPNDRAASGARRTLLDIASRNTEGTGART